MLKPVALIGLLVGWDSPVAASGVDPVVPGPANWKEFECAMHQLAYEHATAKVTSNAHAIYDALNLDNCTDVIGREVLNAFKGMSEAKPRYHVSGSSSTAGAHSEYSVTVYVSTTGSDGSPGTESSPFATLQRARDYLRGNRGRSATASSASPARVLVYGGRYFLNETLSLDERDSNTVWSAAQGQAVTLFGGKLLSGLKWSPHGNGSFVADVKLPVRLRSPKAFAKPPALVNQLFINNTRAIRARFPNGNPQDLSGLCIHNKVYGTSERCTGYTFPSHGVPFGPNFPNGTIMGVVKNAVSRSYSPNLSCHPPGQCKAFGNFMYTVIDPPSGHPVYDKPVPGLGWNNNSLFSFWASPFARPSSFQVDPDKWTDKSWSNPSTAVVHMFHGQGWGNWQFQVSGTHARGENTVLDLAYGGYQEARGADTGSGFYVENVLEELDSPNEWFFDEDAGKLYVQPNGTLNEATEIAVPLLDELIRIESSNSAPGVGTRAELAHDIVISGFELTGTRATFLEQYEVPSGGDWSVHRSATLVVQDAERVNISGCLFNQTGGNALLLSNHVVDSTVEHNEFVHTGDSAIVSLGATQGGDGTAPTYPDGNWVVNNHMHEIGTYGKQVSCYFQSLTARSVVKDNVCYNTPRAGFNLNDGFFGQYDISGNVLFNHVRETGDHGPVNSWDRQPYVTRNGRNDGYPAEDKFNHSDASWVGAYSYISRNFILNGYNGVWSIDHDDGSQFYNDSQNVLVWGGCKNWLGHHKVTSANVILYPGVTGRSQGNRRCQTNDQGNFGEQYYHDDTCVTADGEFYSFDFCTNIPHDEIPQHVYNTSRNTFYSPGAKFVAPCGTSSFSEWQSYKQDVDSVVKPTPSLDTIVSLCKTTLNTVDPPPPPPSPFPIPPPPPSPPSEWMTLDATLGAQGAPNQIPTPSGSFSWPCAPESCEQNASASCDSTKHCNSFSVCKATSGCAGQFQMHTSRLDGASRNKDDWVLYYRSAKYIGPVANTLGSQDKKIGDMHNCGNDQTQCLPTAMGQCDSSPGCIAFSCFVRAGCMYQLHTVGLNQSLSDKSDWQFYYGTVVPH